MCLKGPQGDATPATWLHLYLAPLLQGSWNSSSLPLSHILQSTTHQGLGWMSKEIKLGLSEGMILLEREENHWKPRARCSYYSEIYPSQSQHKTHALLNSSVSSCKEFWDRVNDRNQWWGPELGCWSLWDLGGEYSF